MDSHSLLAENDGEIDIELLHNLQRHSLTTRLFLCCRQLFIPTSLTLALQSQQQLLKAFVASPIHHKCFKLADGGALNYVDIAGADPEYRSNHLMDALYGSSVSTASGSGSGSKPTLVLMHGFGSGLAMFFDNYDKFAQQFGRVIAVDWRGMGLSSRDRQVPHPCSCCCCTCCCGSFDETLAINFFLESLHEMMEGLNLTNVVLAGHSLGGYLCAQYVMKYHSRPEGATTGEIRSSVLEKGPSSPVKGLILFSPAGLEPMPADVMPPSRVSFKASVASTLLRSNYTPQGLLRAFGCFGRERVHMLVARRFGSDRWSTEEAELISDYLYHISAQPSGGENALNALLQLIFTTVPGPDGPFYRPKVLARKPITPAELAAGLTPSRGAPTSSGPDRSSLSSVNPSIPLLLMYGDSDWLSFPGARKFADVLKGDLGTEVTFATIRNAGHHLYMDNAGQFHSTIDTWMQKHFPPPSV